jgi:hypothetical protein
VHNTGKVVVGACALAAIIIGSGSAVAESANRPLATEADAAFHQTPPAPDRPAVKTGPVLTQAPAAAASVVRPAWVKVRQGLNLRAGTTTDSLRHGKLAHGAQLTVGAEVRGQDPYGTGQNVWYQVIGAQTAYVWAGGLSLAGAPPVAAAVTVKPAKKPAKAVYTAKYKKKPAAKPASRAKKVKTAKKSTTRSAPVRHSVGAGGGWAALRQCESGGRYNAVSASGKYRGAYQFDQRTWNGVGGTGDPAKASPAEQDKRAAILYSQRGTRPWPNCGKRM